MLTKSVEGLADLGGFYPKPATIVTSKSKGRENAMAVAWHSIFSMKPPAYGVAISKKRFTHQIIAESGAFAVNFMSGKDAKLVAAVGGCSGRDVHKFKEFHIKKKQGLVLDVPLVRSAYYAIECRVIRKIPVGDHDWFVGRVLATHWSQDAFDENGSIKFENATPTTYLGNDNYLVIGEGRKRHLDRKKCVEESKRRFRRERD